MITDSQKTHLQHLYDVASALHDGNWRTAIGNGQCVVVDTHDAPVAASTKPEIVEYIATFFPGKVKELISDLTSVECALAFERLHVAEQKLDIYRLQTALAEANARVRALETKVEHMRGTFSEALPTSEEFQHLADSEAATPWLNRILTEKAPA